MKKSVKTKAVPVFKKKVYPKKNMNESNLFFWEIKLTLVDIKHLKFKSDVKFKFLILFFTNLHLPYKIKSLLIV